MIDQVRRGREELATAIANDILLAADATGTQRPQGPMGTTAEGPDTMEFANYRHSYMNHQQTMEARIGNLRAQVRATVAGESEALARLAALDAAMEQALGAQQRRVLGQLPALLEKHFIGQRLSLSRPLLHRKAPGAETQAATQARGALTAYPLSAAGGPSLQQALLAELDLRLQPVMGLVEALGARASGHA